MPTIPIKDFIYIGAILAIIASGAWYRHKLIAEGVAKQQAIDSAASAKLIAKTAEQTAELQARASQAEQAFDKERNDNQNYRDSHPIEPVRLCLSTVSRIIVSQDGAAHAGDAKAGAASAGIQSMPDGNSSSGARRVGPDIEPMLSALGAAADQVSAVLREFQAR